MYSGADHRIRVAMGVCATIELAPFAISHYVSQNWYMFWVVGALNVCVPIEAALMRRSGALRGEAERPRPRGTGAAQSCRQRHGGQSLSAIRSFIK
jgi:hypothetical protein